MKNNELFINMNTIAKDLINKYEYPFEVLPHISDYIKELGKTLDDSYKKIADDIWISKTAKVDKSATIIGPCIIDHEAEIRCNAFIRGNAIIGKNCVFGNSCEIKNAIMFDGSKIPHFSYIGDSIIGYKAHLGAGSIISNRKHDKSDIFIKGEEKINTGLGRVGAFLGDNVEVGCNCVLNPGTIIGSYTTVYPLTSVRGYIKSDMIVKSSDNMVIKK